MLQRPCFLFSVCLVLAGQAGAQPCVTITPIGSANDEGIAALIQPDGNLVVAGFSYNGTNEDFALVRYATDFSLDPTFGVGGIVTTAIGPGDEDIQAMALQPDGKIIAVGRTLNGGFDDFAVARYLPSGALDPTFGVGGIAITSVGPGDDSARDVAIQFDGKIVVTGHSSTNDFVAVRYNPDGTPDASFGVAGIATVPLPSIDRTRAITIQSDGRIVLAGRVQTGDRDFALMRLLPDGSPDVSFDADGIVTTGFGVGSDDVVHDVALQPDGRIVVVGSTDASGSTDFAAVRYNPDGSLDTSFDTDGVVTTDLGGGIDVAHSLALQPDGKVVLGGFTRTGTAEFALVRYLPDGRLDPSFDDDGIVRTSIGASDALAEAVVLRPDGRLLLAGYSGAPSDFTVAPYLADGSLDLSCITNYRSIGTEVPYTTGTITATAGSAIVTGTSVAWITANRGQGDYIDVGGQAHTILSVDSETTLTLTRNASANYSGVYTIDRQEQDLRDWESCIDGGPCRYFGVASSDLVSDNRVEVGIAYNDSTFTDSVTFNGFTTGPNHTVALTVHPRNRHTGVAGTGVLLDAGGQAIQVEENHVTIEWLEIRADGQGYGASGISGSAELTVQYCIFIETNGASLQFAASGADVRVFNNIIYRAEGKGLEFQNSPFRARVYNNTVYDSNGAGITGSGSSIDLRNNISMDNNGADFDVSGHSTLSRENYASDSSGTGHSPFQGGRDDVTLGEVAFVSTSTGSEDFHITSGSVAENTGADASAYLVLDIDGDFRQNPWDVGADDIRASSVITISSQASQSFFVGEPPKVAAPITITEDPLQSTIKATNDLRIRIPASFHMEWDDTVGAIGLSGPAAGKVANVPIAYEDFGQTVVLDVLFDFAPGEALIITGLGVRNFVAPSPPASLELETGNDGVAVATDDKTLDVQANSGVTISSAADQTFTDGAPPEKAAPIFITAGSATPFIDTGNHIIVSIPAGVMLEWDTLVPTVMISGTAAGKVNTTPQFVSNTVLRLWVTSNFAPGEYIEVRGLSFQNFTFSGPDSLEVTAGASFDTDDKLLNVTVAEGVPFFTATATEAQVLLEWVNPSLGDCDKIHVRAKDDGGEPTMGDRAVADIDPCVLGQKLSVVDPGLNNDQLYGYAIFVEDSGGGLTPPQYVKARPFAVGTRRWGYSTGAASLAAPGLRFQTPDSFVYAVSNDSILHSMVGGLSGGMWPGLWTPRALGAPAQTRPPVVGFAVGSPAVDPAAFLGAQDGKIYAVNAVDGTITWTTSIGPMVQAAPAGHFSAYLGGAHDLVITGTRAAGAPNHVEALNVHTGVSAWIYDNSSFGGDGKEIGVINGTASIDYVNARAYFASRKNKDINGSPNTLWCISFTAGAPAYEWAIDVGDVDGSPVRVGNVIYVGNTTGTIYAVDATGGGVKWSKNLADGAVKGFIFPEVGTSNLLLSTNKTVWSVEDQGFSVAINWTIPDTIIPGPSTPSFVPGFGKVLVGSSDGHLYQIDVASPLTPTRVKLGIAKGVIGQPTVDLLQNTIYVGSTEGVIYGIAFPIP